MKRLIILCLSLLVCGILNARNFKVDVNYLIFHLPDDTSYLELQYLIYGDGLHYKEVSPGKFQGCVKAEITLKGIEDKALVLQRQMFYLTAFYTNDATDGKNNNFNLSRIPLPSKKFRLHVSLRDTNNPDSETLSFSTEIDLTFKRDQVCASSIQRVGAYSTGGNHSVFTKNAINLIPYFSNYYPALVDSITYMWEIYNTDKVFAPNEVGKIESYITEDPKQEEDRISARLHYTLNFAPTDKYIHFLSLPIDSLPSGNYYLVNKVFSPEGKLLIKDEQFFQRSNPGVGVRYQMENYISANGICRDSLPLDTLKQYIDYLFPLAKGEEVDFIRKAKRDTDYVALANFFRYFWEKRSPEDPWDGWYQYYGDVKRVNHKFTTLRFKGYKTDRGHYYLKYGAPSDIEYHPIENGMNPYEIWIYYQLDDQTDVYFIFGDLDLNTKNYTMICSNKKDEIYDPRWKLRLKPKELRSSDINITE